MSHKFFLTNHPDTVALAVYDDLSVEDLDLDFEIGLNVISTVYITLDASGLTSPIAGDVLQQIGSSSFFHENIAHLAVYANSAQSQFIAMLMARGGAGTGKLSVHQSYAEALAYSADALAENLPFAFAEAV